MYTLEKILTLADIDQLINVYKQMKPELAHQDYNLFDVDKRHITSEYRNIAPLVKLDEYAKLDNFSHYFLEYGVDGFTRFHTDDDDRVGLTIVTLLEEVDLIGGETLIQLPYEKRERPSNKYAKRQGKDEAPLNQRIIPRLVRSEVGDSMIYDKSLMHGVAQVEQGTRLVLVSWYKVK